MFCCHVNIQIRLLCSFVWAQCAHIRFFSSVSSNVLCQVIPVGSPVRAIGTRIRFFSCMAVYVFLHQCLSRWRIRTVWAWMHFFHFVFKGMFLKLIGISCIEVTLGTLVWKVASRCLPWFTCSFLSNPLGVHLHLKRRFILLLTIYWMTNFCFVLFTK